MTQLKFFTLMLLLLILSCATAPSKEAKPYRSSTDHLILLQIPNANILYKHLIVNTNIEKGSTVANNVKLGSFQPYPQVFSTKYHYQILESKKLYNEKNFQKAADVLKEPYENEKQNPILLDTYARAIYNFDRKKSYEIYKSLIDLIDNEKEIKLTFTIQNNREVGKEIYAEITDLWERIKIKKKNKIILDPWFSESYWKIGTLYLDQKDYLSGAFEITRALYLGLDKNPALKEFALSYLTEAMYYLKKDKLALYFANETFKVNPSNQYVIRYLDSINRTIK